MDATGPEAERKRLNAFVKARPEEVRVWGNENYIIVAVTLRVGTGAWAFDPLSKYWDERLTPADPASIPSKLKTFLSTGAGNRVSPARFEPHDQVGDKYDFPRLLTDGTPLVDGRSKELRFEAMIQRRRIKVKFDPSKMVYQVRILTSRPNA